MEIDPKRFKAMERDVRVLREMVLDLSTFLTERLTDDDEVRELTKGAWRRARPEIGLTWNAKMTGDEFVGHMVNLLGRPLGRTLEIGPGYGRVLGTVLGRDLGLDSYTGVDISEQNVEYLRGHFTDPRLSFVHSDVFEFASDEPFDTVYSSAVFLHIYPDVGAILRRCRELLRRGGSVCFDVPLGGRRYINRQRQLFVREYTEPELERFAAEAGYSACRIVEEAEFSPGQRGLFACATV